MNAATTPDHLHRVQKLRKAALVVGLVLVCAVAFVTQGGIGETAHETVEAVGLVAILLCVVGRAWCSLYIGGRKTAEIVDRGPYSIVRNPLYVFSFLGAFGMGAQTGSVTLAFAFFALTWLVFYPTVRQEEGWLEASFGEPCRAYMRRTPRFMPDFRQWRDQEVLQVRPIFFLLTLRDGLIFFLPIFLFEGLEQVQSQGWLHTLLSLP